MRVGIHNVRFDFPGAPDSIAPTLAATARVAEEVGVSAFTLMDHWFQMDQHGTGHRPDAGGLHHLSAFSPARPRRMRLGLLVTGVTYRHPGLLAKIVATLDVLSGGRALLGIGAAWYEREHNGSRACRSRRWPNGSNGWRRPCRSAGRCGATTTAPYDGHALPAGRDHLLNRRPITHAPPADPDRRQRGTEDAAAGCPVRGCVQPLRRRPRRRRPQARRAGRPLRPRGSRPCHGRADHPVRARPVRRCRHVRRRDGRLRPSRGHHGRSHAHRRPGRLRRTGRRGHHPPPCRPEPTELNKSSQTNAGAARRRVLGAFEAARMYRSSSPPAASPAARSPSAAPPPTRERSKTWLPASANRETHKRRDRRRRGRRRTSAAMTPRQSRSIVTCSSVTSRWPTASPRSRATTR